MPKSTRNAGKLWTRQELKQLRAFAKANMPTRVMSVRMGRTLAAIYKKASEEGISLKPVKRRADTRRKKR